MVSITNPCYTIQDLANLITQYGINIEELKLNLLNTNQAAIIFKKGGSLQEGFPGQVIVAEYTEDIVQLESTPPEDII
jgi:hypothetical protein